jgi:membrane-associated phospholipid phosphatase
MTGTSLETIPTMVSASLKRPYRVTIPMVVLVSLVPLYVFIASGFHDRTVYAPSTALDHAIPVVPVWSLVYGALYLFLIALPVFVVREEEHLRRTVWAYLLIWITAYIIFMSYPTIAPRPEKISETGFGAWGLEFLYDVDPPYNCFPSLHVAHSFVSALTAYRVHRQVGIFAIVSAAIVAISTLFTKQHYVVDVIGGVALALIAYWLFLRTYSREKVPDLDHRVAPVFAAGILVGCGLAVMGAWAVYFVLG